VLTGAPIQLAPVALQANSFSRLKLNTPVTPQNVKQQLILSAIELFAEQGVEAISMRMINRGVGTKNNSAAHYHFGSKEGLVDAAILFIQEWFENRREAQLSLMEAQALTEAPDIREILALIARPYLQIMQEEAWGYSAVRFIAHTQFDKDSFSRHAQQKYVKSFVKRLSALARQAVPSVPEDILMYRLNFAASSLIQHLANSRLQETGWFHSDSEHSDAILELYLDYSAAGMSAPIAGLPVSHGFMSHTSGQISSLV